MLVLSLSPPLPLLFFLLLFLFHPPPFYCPMLSLLVSLLSISPFPLASRSPGLLYALYFVIVGLPSLHSLTSTPLHFHLPQLPHSGVMSAPRASHLFLHHRARYTGWMADREGLGRVPQKQLLWGRQSCSVAEGLSSWEELLGSGSILPLNIWPC